MVGQLAIVGQTTSCFRDSKNVLSDRTDNRRMIVACRNFQPDFRNQARFLRVVRDEDYHDPSENSLLHVDGPVGFDHHDEWLPKLFLQAI